MTSKAHLIIKRILDPNSSYTISYDKNNDLEVLEI